MASVTGSWTRLAQATFNEVHPNGGFQHFRENTAAQSAVRAAIVALGIAHGWPLDGLFISGVGNVPHYALHVSDFPPQIGGQRAEKLQIAIDALLAGVYEDQDPFGTGDLSTWLVAKNHIWTYRNNLSTMEPRINGAGDFDLAIFDPRITPPSNWWQGQ